MNSSEEELKKMVMKTSPKRRNLSGIYIFDVLPGDVKRKPTVFEDCTEAKQDEWLNSLGDVALKSLCKNLGRSLRGLGDQFDIMSGVDEDDEDEDYPIDILNEH
jgi:hypothetical protein